MSCSGQSDWREQRVAKNEVTSREYNDRRERFERPVTEERIPFVCECGDRTCVRVLMLSSDEWRDAHPTERLFTVLPGHLFAEFERIVSREDGYWVIEKFEAPSRVLADDG